MGNKLNSEENVILGLYSVIKGSTFLIIKNPFNILVALRF